MSAALTEWTIDRRVHIQFARSITQAFSRSNAAQTDEGDLALASYLRVCCSEFQAFCSALYLEAVEAIRTHLNDPDASGRPRVPAAMSAVLVNTFTYQTKLSRGNPNMANLIADFDRLGVNLRRAVIIAMGLVSADDIKALDEELLDARNQLLHGEVRMGSLRAGRPPQVVGEDRINLWVQSLDRLADTLDRAVTRDLSAPLGSTPW